MYTILTPKYPQDGSVLEKSFQQDALLVSSGMASVVVVTIEVVEMVKVDGMIVVLLLPSE